jgi:hypothetical protein
MEQPEGLKLWADKVSETVGSLVVERIETSQPKFVLVSKCMLKPRETEPIYLTDVKFSTLEGQLMKEVDAP